jgi:hypothetical protein
VAQPAQGEGGAEEGNRFIALIEDDAIGWPSVDVVVTNLAHTTTVNVTGVVFEARDAGVVYQDVGGQRGHAVTPGRGRGGSTMTTSLASPSSDWSPR